MSPPTRRRHAVWIACCLMLLACRTEGGAVGMAEKPDVGSKHEGPFILDLENRTVTRPIGSELAAATSKKFVEIEITDVLNPKRIRLIFEVYYQPEKGEKSLLGTFSLFPPDNPGTFIVATRGSLRSEGTIILSMLVLDKVGPEDEVRVTVKRISFRD